VPGVFKVRRSRFLGEVQIEGRRSLCFIPNPGRMEELLGVNVGVYLLERHSHDRKTCYDLVLVDLDGTLVSIDSRVPNKVVAEGIERGRLPEFQGLKIMAFEPHFLDSRLDLHLVGDSCSLMLELKSCTLVIDGIGLFPDAPTERGRRHLRALVQALETGRAAMLFLIQRADVRAFQPNEGTDPEFAAALRYAADHGVEIYAYSSDVTLQGVSISKRVPVKLLH
jgi:sugar fermentation stimulation protein A